MARVLNVLLNTVGTTALLSCLTLPVFAVTTDVLLPPDVDKPNADSGSTIAPIAPIAQPDATTPAKPSALSSVMSYFNKPATGSAQQAQQLPVTDQTPILPPTHILKLPATPSAQQSAAFGKGSTPLSITMPETPWTSFNSSMVASHLGITADEVVRKCSPTYNGRIISDKGIYAFGGNGTASATYDGTINTITVNVLALCEVKTLPSNAGLVVQVGDKYEVPLSNMMCRVTKGASVSRVQFTMDSSGIARCTYQ